MKTNPAETNPKEQPPGSSKTRRVTIVGLLLCMVMVLGVGVHFCGWEGALKKNSKSMGIVICCVMGIVSVAFFGKKVIAMRKEKAP